MITQRRVEVQAPSWLRLLLISIASLYYELLLIRWLPTEVRILAYFTNVTLISCILGLGVGVLLSREKWIRPSWSLPLLAALLLLSYLYSGLDVVLPLASEGNFVWNGLSRAAKGTPLQYLALFVFFTLNTAVFVPIGQLLGQEFDALPAIPAYLVNVIGALLGVIIFACFSLLRLSPLWWFAVGLALLVFLVRVSLVTSVAIGIIVALSAMGALEPGTYWSPYYKVTTRPVVVAGAPPGTEVSVNEDSHQQAFDLSGRLDSIPELRTRRRVYDEPYQYGSNHDVLVLGAGTGNDVAAALRAGATHVDAVEIDPVILELGAQVHPERPYEDHRVTRWNREARTFLRESNRRYDKIVLGYVDSHSLFSAMSSVRLDNFVYTAEAFGEMRQHLTPNGVLAVTFTVHERWIADRLYSLFEHTFGTPPLVFQGAKSSSSGTVFLGGRPVENLKPRYLSFSPTDARDEAGHTWRYELGAEGYLSPSALQIAGSIPTDDWPYLYLRDRGVPANYLLCIAGLFALSLLTIRGTTGLHRVRWPFFFLGAAFLLVETKAMTELAIFLGSTWTVNFFVITAVLGLIVAGTLLVLIDRAPSTSLTFIVLALVLAATYASPLEALLGWDSPLRNWVVVLILCLPLFFAAIIFARIIRHEAQPSVALGSNLLGALAGGLLEYSSMAFGLRSLYLWAITLYAIAWLTLRRQNVEFA